MIRLLVLYNTPTDIGAFEKHYREVHIPLVKKIEGLRRFTLSRNAAPIHGGAPYFLVAELEWDDMDAFNRAFQSPEGQATANDVANLEQLSPGVHSMFFEVEEV